MPTKTVRKPGEYCTNACKNKVPFFFLVGEMIFVDFTKLPSCH